MFRAKYFVGEAVSRITRTALTLGGAHAIFKTSPWNGCFATGNRAHPVSIRLFLSRHRGVLELGLISPKCFRH